MKTVKDNIEIKKPHSTLFPDAIISDDMKKYHDSPANRKKVEEAKKFLANFNYK